MLSKTAVFLLMAETLLLVIGCTLMRWGVCRKSRRIRTAAYAVTLLSALGAAVSYWYFNAGPGRYVPTGRLEPEQELLFSGVGTGVFLVLLFGFFCRGYHQRVLELTENT